MTAAHFSLESFLPRITYYWQHQKSGRWPAPLVTPKLTQRCPMMPKLLITQTKHMGHWVKGVCCVWQDTFTDRDLQTQGPGREGQWKWTFSLYTTSHHTAWGHLLSRVGHSAHSEKCAQLGFREFWVNWSILLEECTHTVLGFSLKPLNGVSISFLDPFLVLD